MVKSRIAFERAQYLAEAIQRECFPEMGLGGRCLFEWLSSALSALDPVPPPPDPTYVHLFVDRYWKEARTWDKKALSAAWNSELSQLVQSEARVTRDILRSMNADSELERFNSGFDSCIQNDGKVRFSDARRLISDALLELSNDGYRLRPSQATKSPDDLIREMVESSSARLATLSVASEDGPS